METKKYEYIDSLCGMAILMVILVHIPFQKRVVPLCCKYTSNEYFRRPRILSYLVLIILIYCYITINYDFLHRSATFYFILAYLYIFTSGLYARFLLINLLKFRDKTWDEKLFKS